MADKDDNWHDRVLEMADDLGLKGDDRRKYVHQHMTRKGYRMEPTYVPNDDSDDDDSDDDGFFPRSRKSRRSSRDDDDTSGSRRKPKSGGPDSWYS